MKAPSLFSNPSMAMMNRKTKDLPMDVVYEVLVRLPVKTLVRFRSVCKAWNSLITHPPFEQDHYCRRQQNPLLLYFQVTRNGLIPSSYSYISEKGFTLVNKSSLKVPYPGTFYKVLSCLGLVCIAGSSIFILNPVSGERVALPPMEGFIDCIGFGYKASSQEFKVVRFHYSPLENKEYCMVFTLGGEWREAKSPPYRVCCGDAPFLHEAFHLLHKRGASYTISVFGIEREDYKEIMTPECLTDDPHCHQLTELGGSICLVESYKSSGRPQVALWLLKDYENEEWVKKYNIDLTSETTVSFRVNAVYPLAILCDGSILLHVWGTSLKIGRWKQLKDLVFYRPQDKTVLLKVNNCSSGVLYVESLKSLRR